MRQLILDRVGQLGGTSPRRRQDPADAQPAGDSGEDLHHASEVGGRSSSGPAPPGGASSSASYSARVSATKSSVFSRSRAAERPRSSVTRNMNLSAERAAGPALFARPGPTVSA